MRPFPSFAYNYPESISAAESGKPTLDKNGIFNKRNVQMEHLDCQNISKHGVFQKQSNAEEDLKYFMSPVIRPFCQSRVNYTCTSVLLWARLVLLSLGKYM